MPLSQREIESLTTKGYSSVDGLIHFADQIKALKAELVATQERVVKLEQQLDVAEQWGATLERDHSVCKQVAEGGGVSLSDLAYLMRIRAVVRHVQLGDGSLKVSVQAPGKIMSTRGTLQEAVRASIEGKP